MMATLAVEEYFRQEGDQVTSNSYNTGTVGGMYWIY